MKKYVLLPAIFLSFVDMNIAHAQVSVVDQGDIAQSITNTTREVDQAINQLNQLKQQYQLLQNIPNVATGMMQGLNSGYIQNPLPSVEQATSEISGVGNTLNSYGQNFYNQNNQYAPIGSDPVANGMTQRATSLANIQGIAANNLESINERLNDLSEMKETLSGATDITQVSAINGRIQAENQAIQAQSAAAQNLQTMAQAQIAQQELQQQEWARQDDLKAATARSGN